ncbi:hypothetical protein EAY46_15260 [Vibrio anguillarum]|nr:hypothetical protein [Vibrio anguillarum]
MGDLHWIANLLLEGADDGHFLPSIKSQAMVFLHAIVESGGVTMIKIRGDVQSPTFVPMEITVAEFDGTPASFLICCKEHDAIEIHLAGTQKSFRKKGCFNQLVSDAISKNSSISRVYARCYTNSSKAIQGLKKMNFKPTKSGNPIELTLSR